MQLGFYFDQSRCIGCKACIAACRSWNRLEQEMPDPIEITSEERGEFPDTTLSHLFLTCFHCADPACVAACPEGLLVKRATDGVVVISDPERCTFCQLCTGACPYHAPKAGQTRLVKCEMCLDRVSEGRKPACVASCPTEALDAAPMDELIKKYGNCRDLEGFPDYRRTQPSVVFRARP